MKFCDVIFWKCKQFFSHSVKHTEFLVKRDYLQGILLQDINKKLQLKHTELLMRPRATTMLCRKKKHAEIGWNSLKIMILILKINNAQKNWKQWKMKNRKMLYFIENTLLYIIQWRLISDVSWTCKIFRSWSHNNFETLKAVRTILSQWHWVL